MTLTLNNLQQQFVANLKKPTADFLGCIQSSETLSSKEHLDIYHSSVFGALQNVLKDIYTVCLKLVGEEFFITMIQDYITTTYSISPDLGEYGETLPEYIAQFSPAKSLPYLADVARLEQAWHKVFNAENNKILDLEKLTAIYTTDGENIVFLLPPRSVLLSSPFPIHRIWEINQADYAGNEVISLDNNQHYYFFIWRSHLEMRIDLLSSAAWQILSWIQQKLTLGQIAEEIEKQMIEINLTEALSWLMNQQYIEGFEIASDYFMNTASPSPI